MNIWFMIWIFLSCFLLGIFLWSFQILLRQKRAWIEFAKKNNLARAPGKFFASSAISGEMSGFNFVLYSEQQVYNENGSQRFRTVLHFDLKCLLPTNGIIASPDAAKFAKALSLKEELKAGDIDMSPNISIFTDSAENLKSYLTPERCKSLNAVMSIKSFASFLIFDTQNTYLRFETADPMTDAAKLDRFVQKALEHAKVIAVK